MKAKMSEMEKENQELRSKFDQIAAKADLRAEQSNQMMLRAIQALRSGKVSDEDFDVIQLMMSTPNSQVPSSVSGGTTNHIGLESHHSTSNS